MHAFSTLAILIAAACGLIVVTSVHAHTHFDSILAFGDSYTDNVRCSTIAFHPVISSCAQGNGTWVQTNHTIPADPAFWQGRFSNGLTWVEHLQAILGVETLLDLAYGGGKHFLPVRTLPQTDLLLATINNTIAVGHPTPGSATIVSPSVTDQVAAFLNSSVDQVDAHKTLCVLVAGHNDAAFGGVDLDVRAITDSLVNNVGLLVAKGQRPLLD
jgi:phospholipase/lecithinase/hemolysin